jgi:hypothetical protein
MSVLRYRLVDINNNTYDLSPSDYFSIERNDDKSSTEIKLVERSNQAGAEVSGDPRDKSKEISFSFNYCNQDESDFRTFINNLLYQFKKAVKIQDVINSIETEIIFSDPSLKYDTGSVHKVVEGGIKCKQITPYWRDINLTSHNINPDSNAYEYTINNTGWVETPSYIQVSLNSAISSIPDFTVRIKNTTFGINIQDSQFGINNLNYYQIDNKDGICQIWDGLISPVDRTDKIYAGTGFFNLQIGIQTLQFINLQGASILLYYRNRYYL